MPTLQEQIATAKAAGYSDADIAKHLSSRADLAPKIKQATEAGYKPEQIIAHLSDAPAASAKPETSAFEDFGQAHLDAAKAINQHGLNLGAGAIRGAGSIGATLMYPIDKATDLIMGDRGPNVEGLISGQQPESRNEERRRQMTQTLKQEFGAEPESKMFKTGKIGAEIAGTAGAGGATANVVGRAAPAFAATATGSKILSAIASGGFKTGAPVATNMLERAADLGIRSAGGAVNGGVSAGLVNPGDAPMGAGIGGALPGVLTGAAKVGGYAGNALYSLVQPFTTAGQERLAGNIINKFAESGPRAVDSRQLVPGSVPTLAEATGNSGVAGLQRSIKDSVPSATNRFSEREAANAAARTAAFDNVAGDAGKLDYFRADRAAVGTDLYEKALQADTGANITPYLKGQVTQLLKRPSITEARKTAQRWAIERGEKPSFDANMRGLHDMKTAIDDQISTAVIAGKGGEAKALAATQDKLLDVMDKLSPEYAQARATYAEMSKPVNQMEVLQGLKLTDQRGNITLQKIQSAISSLESKMSGPGNDAAKSLTGDQLGTLRTIRNDLLRQANLSNGKSIGSNTFQNISTDNIISEVLPGKYGELAKAKAGGALGQAGKLLYSGPNEAIRNRLTDMMLDPNYAARAMETASRPVLDGRRVNALRDLTNQTVPILYRGAPVLSYDR